MDHLGVALFDEVLGGFYLFSCRFRNHQFLSLVYHSNPIINQNNTKCNHPHTSLSNNILPSDEFHNNMTQIIIPANTNNSICKVADFEFGPYPSALYIGSLQAAGDPFTLKQYKIGSVLTVASQFVVKPGAGIAHKVIAVEDSPFEDLYQYISEANEFIAKQLGRGNVLVHCRAGISRSATLVLAFLMKSKRWKLKHALEFLRIVRPIVKPNEGFMEQLKNYQRKLVKALEQRQMKLK